MPDLPADAPLAPLDIAACIAERLGAEHPQLQIYGVLDMARAKPALRAPCVAVLPLEDALVDVLSPDLDAAVVQRMKSTVATVVGVEAANDPGGARGRAAERLAALLVQVRRSLLGWAPDGPFPTEPPTGPPHSPARPAGAWPLVRGRPGPLVWERGRLVMLGEGRAWWQDEYATRWLVRSRPHEAPDDGPPPTCVSVSVNGGPPAPLPAAVAG